MATTSTPTSTVKMADTASWIHGCFTVKVGAEFKTFKDIMTYALADESFDASTVKVIGDILGSIATSDTDTNAALPKYFSSRKCRDTTLGGNDAINPLPQFGIDDDIAHDHLTDASGNADITMGQIYSENYDDLQQVLYLGFGIPLFSNVGSFWTSATDLDMANFVNQGKGITVEKIGYLIGSLPIRIFNIATVPLKFIAAISDGLQKVPISKYYTFSSQMPMYFRFVNTILVMLATNMNIMGSSDEMPDTSVDTPGKESVTLLGESDTDAQDMSGISTVFRESGLDMAKIMTKRYMYENGKNTEISKRSTDEGVIKGSALNAGEGNAAPSSDTTSTTPDANGTNSNTTTTADSGQRTWTMAWVDNFKAAYGGAIYDGHLFIGFRIDKGMGGTESFSNTVGESKISATINEKFQSGAEVGFQTMHGDFGESGVGALVTGTVDAVKGLLQGITMAFSMDPLAAVATGAAKIDIPEVWMNSSYGRTANFSLTLLSPYGDMESIFQSLYVPFACILAGALPRGTGHSSHAAPFVCQAYCRGIFSSPLSIIENLEVTRGADQFGMNMARLPLKLVMHVTLKDLSPVMYMNMGGNSGLLNAIMGNDDVFGEYMLTLSGMGLRDRLAPFRASRRKIKILLSTAFKNKLSPFMLGMEGGSRFTISRMISTVISSGKSLPSN